MLLRVLAVGTGHPGATCLATLQDIGRPVEGALWRLVALHGCAAPHHQTEATPPLTPQTRAGCHLGDFTTNRRSPWYPESNGVGYLLNGQAGLLRDGGHHAV